MDKARNAAVAVIIEVAERGAYSNIALSKILRADRLNNLDRRFCTELVNGTVKCGASLDWIIGQYINRPLEKIDPKVRAILRVAAYQLKFLDRVPPSAAVNEAVEIAKTIHVGASKFVNGVLRSMLRAPERSEFPTDDSAQSLALRTFHPTWLVARWLDQFGLERTKAILAADNQPPPITLRVNCLKTDRATLIARLRELGADAQPSELVEDGIVCRSLGALDELEPLREGLCMVQDESSMMIARVLAPQSGEFVLDCCAAPGGKSTHMAELMGNRGMIVAVDVHSHKIKLLQDNARRLGVTIIKPLVLDVRELGVEFRARADRVLVDAPCSGLGVLRRKADIRWRKTPEEIARLPVLQLEIISRAALAVKLGGVLVYSTCTLERAENENVVGKFLSGRDDFELLESRTLLPGFDGADGFFYAKLRRCGG